MRFALFSALLLKFTYGFQKFYLVKKPHKVKSWFSNKKFKWNVDF